MISSVHLKWRWFVHALPLIHREKFDGSTMKTSNMSMSCNKKYIGINKFWQKKPILIFFLKVEEQVEGRLRSSHVLTEGTDNFVANIETCKVLIILHFDTWKIIWKNYLETSKRTNVIQIRLFQWCYYVRPCPSSPSPF